MLFLNSDDTCVNDNKGERSRWASQVLNTTSRIPQDEKDENMSSQHLYTLADQLGAFDNEPDLDLKKPRDDVEKSGDKEPYTYSGLASPSISETSTLPIESSSRWTIGWVTPSAILSCFLMGKSQI